MHATLMILIVPYVTTGEKEINLETLWNAFLRRWDLRWVLKEV